MRCNCCNNENSELCYTIIVSDVNRCSSGVSKSDISEADIIATENDSMDSTMSSSVMEMVRHCVEPVAAIGPSETDTGSDTPKSPGERERERERERAGRV